MKLLTIITTLFCISLASNAQEVQKDGFIKEIHLGTNIASLVRTTQEDFPRRNLYVTTNRYANVEVILSFHPKFSMRIPFGFGLSNMDGTIKEGGGLENHWFETGPDPVAPVNVYQNGPPLDAPKVSNLILTKYKYSKPQFVFARPQDLVYQFGLFPQLFLYEKENVKLSFTAGVNFGKMDKYAISEYNSFSSIKNATNDTITAWVQTDSRLEYESNTFLFARGEYLFGVDLKFNKKMTFNSEIGFANFINAKGSKPDKIYTNLDNKGYNLIFMDYKNNDFTKVQENYSVKSLSLLVYPIIRFSFRYQIK